MPDGFRKLAEGRVSNAKVRYDFTIRRNITIIKGDSATGKTTLVEMIREYYEAGESSGIELRCKKACQVLSGRNWKTLLDTIHDHIVFIDEDNAFLPTNEFAEAVRESDNYYVIVTREGLPNLPYSVDEIYGIRESGKGGKSNIFAELMKDPEHDILVIADGAAFGPEMDRIMKLVVRKKGIILYLPESFEWLILTSGLIADKNLNGILDRPENFIESSQYFSWERYFTELLVSLTKDSWLKYSKRKLNEVYLHKDISSKIIKQMKKIEL